MSPAPSGRLRRARRASLVVVLGLGAVCAPALAADDPVADLAVDASFESGTAGWAPAGGRLSRVRAADAPDGHRVARIARVSGAGAMSLVAGGLRADTGRGRTYRAEAWVRADAPGSVGAPVTLAVVQRARNGRVVRRWASPPAALGRAFRRLAVTARPWANGGRLEVVVTQRRARRGDAVAVDAVRLVQDGVRIAAADGAGINGSFEAGTAGWNGYSATLSRVAQAGAPDGAYVVKVSRAGSGSSYVLQESTRVGPLAAGARYSAGIWVKAGSASSAGRPIQIKLREWNAAGVVVADTASASIGLGTSWRRIAVSATTRTAGGSLDLRVSQSGAASGHFFLADGATLAEATAAPAPAPAPAARAGARPGPGAGLRRGPAHQRVVRGLRHRVDRLRGGRRQRAGRRRPPRRLRGPCHQRLHARLLHAQPARGHGARDHRRHGLLGRGVGQGGERLVGRQAPAAEAARADPGRRPAGRHGVARGDPLRTPGSGSR